MAPRVNDDQAPLGTMAQTGTEQAGAHPQDLALIRATLSGDRPAIDAVIARLALCVPRYLKAKNRRFGQPLDDATLCDLVQDVMTLVWRKRQGYEGRGPIEGWACAIAALEMYNRIRQARRESRFDAATDPDVSAERCDQPVLDPLDALVLREAVHGIPEVERRIICGKHYDGLSFSEIATTFKMSMNTAKTHYYRGIDRLRRMLRPALGKDDA